MKLRTYQIEIIEGLRKSIKDGNRKIILCAPTGSGKTIMFSFMVSEHLKKGGNILVFTHRKELLNQSGGAFQNFGITPEFIEAGKQTDLNKNIHVAMIETFSRRLESYMDFLQSRTMIICDEAHLENFTKIFAYINEKTIVIGATATPYRKSNQTGLDEFYTDIVQKIDTPKLIELGFLAKPYTFGVEIDLKGIKKKGDEYDTTQYYTENKLYTGVIQNYKKLVEHKKTIVFSSSVKSSIEVCNEFLKYGYNAKHIDANSKDRTEIFEWYKNTDNAILCNCGIATTGFDQPDIQCVILYMATTSVIKMLQCVGRGGRVTENKKDFAILDFGNNIKRLGFWEDERNWSLKKKEKKQGVAPVKYCPKCDAILPAPVMVCTFCDHVFEKSEKEKKDELFAELKLLTKKEINRYAYNLSVEKKAELCKEGLLKPFFVLHQMTDINQARYFIKLMGYKKGFEFYNKTRFKVLQNG